MDAYANTIEELAASQQVSVGAVRQLVDALHERAGAEWFYIFWFSARGAGGAQRTGRTRTLLAFTTPDAALTFAQRNQLSDGQSAPRVRRLSLVQLLLVMLRAPSIVAIRLVRDDETPAAGRLPDGVLIEQRVVLEQLRASPSI